MKILITGGAGFIGSRIANILVQEGHEVYVIDSLTQSIHGQNQELPEHLNKSVIFIKDDLSNIDKYIELLEDINFVYHMAAETGMGESQRKLKLYFNTNVTITAVLLEFLLKLPSLKGLFLASTCRIYGEGTYQCSTHGLHHKSFRKKEQLLKENWEVRCPICNSIMLFQSNEYGQVDNPSSMYAISKLSQEQMVLNWAQQHSISATVLRYQNVYGAGQSFNNSYTGLVSIFSQNIYNKKNIYLFERGKPSRDFVYIDDVVQASVQCFRNFKQNEIEVYDFANGKMLSIKEIASKLIKLFNSNIKIIVSDKFRTGDVLNGCANLSKFKSRYDYESKFDIDEGLKLYVEWFKSSYK